ncbi:MAG: hypothetical protein IJE01_01625 [Clostridia bacterium]|nr:hypothetical protein [Clostridia bacterium]
MREILFRGKRVDDGKWVCGCLVSIEAYNIKTTDGKTNQRVYCITKPYIPFEITVNDADNLDLALYRVTPKTVGQYTGYKIDDIKVFENDIAKVHLEIPYLPHQDKAIDDIGVVCFDTEDLRYYVVSNTGKKYALCYIKGIIGNIHDNPELLESEVSTI